MSGNKTLFMIKPDAVANGYIGEIITRILKAGFRITAMKYTKLSASQARKFYKVHKKKPFYDSLVKFMSSGPMVVVELEKENAVSDFRDLIGATDPHKAEPGSIRNLYATSVEKNAIHGSDSDENAIIESKFFFQDDERH